MACPLFYPQDFTSVCPTEVVGFHKKIAEFNEADAAVVGVSTDSPETLGKWAQELGGIRYPLLSDVDRELSRAYSVLDLQEDLPVRATFIINPEGVIVYVAGHHVNVGRSVDETLRVLRALKTGQQCPADWRAGEETLS